MCGEGGRTDFFFFLWLVGKVFILNSLRIDFLLLRPVACVFSLLRHVDNVFIFPFQSMLFNPPKTYGHAYFFLLRHDGKVFPYNFSQSDSFFLSTIVVLFLFISLTTVELLSKAYGDGIYLFLWHVVWFIFNLTSLFLRHIEMVNLFLV